MSKEFDFNEWLLSKYGVTSDDLTDDDYDMYHEEFMQELEKKYSNASLVYGWMKGE